VMDITDPDAAARRLIESLGQNGAALYAENEVEECVEKRDAAGIAAWQAVFDRVLEIGRHKLYNLGLWR
jgi:hypothetical protein